MVVSSSLGEEVVPAAAAAVSVVAGVAVTVTVTVEATHASLLLFPEATADSAATVCFESPVSVAASAVVSS